MKPLTAVLLVAFLTVAGSASAAPVPPGIYDAQVTGFDGALGQFGSFALRVPTPTRRMTATTGAVDEPEWGPSDFPTVMHLHATGTYSEPRFPVPGGIGYDLDFALRLEGFNAIFPSAIAQTSPPSSPLEITYDDGQLKYLLTIAGGTLTIQVPCGPGQTCPQEYTVPACGAPPVPTLDTGITLTGPLGQPYDPATGTVVYGGPVPGTVPPGTLNLPALHFYMEGCPWAIQKFGEPPGYFLFRDLFRYGTASDPGFLDRMSSPQAISVSVHLTRIGDLPPGPPVELIQDPLDVRLVATRLGSALTHGVPLRLNCFSPCRVAATLRIPRAVAHRYRLRTRTVGALTRRLPAESLRTVRVRFTDRARHALRPAKRVRLRVPVTVDPKQGVTLRKTLRPTLTRG